MSSPIDIQRSARPAGVAFGHIGWLTALRLGRVSNIPTVWTNVLAGIVLSGAAVTARPTILLLVSLSIFYIAGMFLNDAYDRDFDANSRPNRPIPAGHVAAATVFAYGFALLACGIGILLALSYPITARGGWQAPLAGLLLAGVIVLYDSWHKQNPLSPFLMGLCRFLAYLVAGLAMTGALSWQLVAAAVVSLCYLIGLTYVAKQESLRQIKNLWPLAFLAVPFLYGLQFITAGAAASVLYVLLLIAVTVALLFLFRPSRPDVPHAVMLLIAGISLLDGLFIAGQGQTMLAAAAVGAFLLTLFLQRYIAGT
jgi:heme O synthase-like polyprenyltransferase